MFSGVFNQAVNAVTHYKCPAPHKMDEQVSTSIHSGDEGPILFKIKRLSNTLGGARIKVLKKN